MVKTIKQRQKEVKLMKIKTIEDLKKLMKDLGASEETTSDGFTFIELDSKNLKKEQAIEETVPHNDIEEAASK